MAKRQVLTGPPRQPSKESRQIPAGSADHPVSDVGPEDALDAAIALLKAKKYWPLVERFTLPQKLSKMKRTGRFEATVQRFHRGWGTLLLRKLELVRRYPPKYRADGTVEFHVYDKPLGLLTHPVKLIKRNRRWFFLE